jgi:hypothetical protein
VFGERARKFKISKTFKKYMPIDNIHFNAFLETIPNFQNQGAFGHNPANFLQGIINRIGVNNTSQSLIEIQNTLPNYLLNRNHVFAISNDENLSIAYKIVCIFAWGAMRQSTTGADMFFSNWNKYERDLVLIFENFRRNNYTRNWTYEKLKRMNLQGCRPAYYTKLIFFFGNSNAYIMDQWTSKSIELLWTIEDRIGIIFDNGGYIHASNHSGLYEEFCSRVEILTRTVNNQTNSSYSPSEIEEMIFSNGANNGQIRGGWRTYVEANWEH